MNVNAGRAGRTHAGAGATPDLIRSARQVRDWSHRQLADASGLDVATVRRAEQEGVADLRTLHALATALDLPLWRLTRATRERRQQAAWWIAVGLGLVFVLFLSAGYKFGRDLALRENHRDCVAAGRAHCPPP